MKTELTRRERILLFFTAILLMAVGVGRFGILPMRARYTEKTAELDELRFQRLALEQKLQSEEYTRNSYETAAEAYALISLRYPDVIPSEEIDRILTGLCLENNIVPVSLYIHEPVPFVNPDGNEEEKRHRQANPVFVTVSADMRMRGGYDNLKRLIDEAGGVLNIRIGKLTFREEQDTGGTGAPNIIMTFEITMKVNAP